ncbi:DNA circularization N-terminal domain-containing protein [Pannonibacter sp. Pt2]|uniref:DNA circularization N-terminal domain-containing protein n=1 Tax=Pannonibacter anstelovis TaxID=3121537 RepID=A0ABU7ZSC9_9HYPH
MFSSTSDLLPGLRQGSFRGVPFEIIDISHEVGRRIVTHFFPGVDAQAREDQGRLDGPVSVAGFVIGDDYVARARALEAALAQPGPGTLVHPWLGEMLVVVPPGASIRFSTGELRVARVDVQFERTVAQLAPAQATASRLTGAAAALRSGAGAMLAASLASRLAPVDAIASALDVSTGLVQSAISTAAQLASGASLSDSLSSLLRAVTADPSASAVAGTVPDLARVIMQAARPRPRPAIAPGGTATPTATTLAAADGARLALALAAQAASLTTLTPVQAAARAGHHAALTSAAAESAVRIAFSSREEAYGWRDDLDTALSVSVQLTAAMTTALPGPAAAVSRGLRDLRAALYADLNEIIGRLPRTVIVPGGVPALLIAYDLAADQPARVADVAADITRRNRLAHPAVTPLTGVEVLR